MGNGRWDSGSWAQYRSVHVDPVPRAQRFSAGADPANDPAKFRVRESRISAANPRPTPIALGCDITGSMGILAESLMEGGMDRAMREIYARQPVTDPHVMVAAIGDSKGDRAPLQMTQFEADIRLADGVKSLWLEGNGQGNDGESYGLLPLALALKTSCDAIEKQGRRGIAFTFGDEPVHSSYTKAEIERVLGLRIERPEMTAAEIYALAARNWDIFHVVIKEGSYVRSQGGLRRVLDSFSQVLPERVIELDDYRLMPEVVVSTLQVIGGADKTAVAASWGGSATKTIGAAIKNLPAVRGRPSAGGLARY
ncbi:hypothetical protein BHAOGJBA_4501 [Methylobacterium hispanicum]|uniref:VWA domain-containing protein n=1 Tax=Methylobacterium hispanicum TaxID=270350 RepID=A0AAV4ZRY1_9HYPH|nr:hypothetical protein [Methylobacterium hispanicum]GJD90957.1 hypothetical protein BHAOGJBA_4501 [Methylobacterium hispanicum]